MQFEADVYGCWLIIRDRTRGGVGKWSRRAYGPEEGTVQKRVRSKRGYGPEEGRLLYQKSMSNRAN